MKLWERSPGKWYIRYQHEGKQIWKFAGSTKSEATDLLRSIRQRMTLEKLNLPDLPKKKKKHDIRFEKIAEKYLDHCYSDKAYTTYKNEAFRIKGIWLPAFAGQMLSEINPDVIQNWKQSRKASRRTLFNDLQTLKCLFNYAIKMELYSGEDPIGKLPKLYKPEIEIYTPKQIENYLNACPDYYYPIAAILIFTGLRPIELKALKRSDVDLNASIIRVRSTSSLKNVRGREIPINSQLLPILMKQIESHDSQFVITGRKDKRTKLSHGHWIARTKAGLPNLHLYHLRHMFATLLLSEGHDPAAVAELMGHGSLEITMRIYHHLHPERARRVIEAMPQIVTRSSMVADDKPPNAKLLKFKA